ncbi:MAG: type II secretion system F family protein [Actinomycetota bacterium]
MSAAVAILVAAAVLLWPHRHGRRGDAFLLPAPPPSGLVPASLSGLVRDGGRRLRKRRHVAGVSPQDLLGLLDAVVPALEAGLAPASALRIVAEARSGSGRRDPLTALTSDLSAAAAGGARLGPLWRAAAEEEGSAELLLLAQAWSLTEDMGAPLAQAVRTTTGLLEARIAHERRLAAAVAGAKATVTLLTVLPIGGPLVALVLGIGPGELFGGSRLTQGSLALGLALAGVGRLWVRRMVRAVARGPVIA